MKKKYTFFRNLLAILIRSYRWRQNPKNIEVAYTLEHLWKFGFLCCITCFALSCAPVKKLEKIKIETKSDSISTDKSEIKTVKSIDLIEKEWNDLETRILVYDTDKPIDSVTHKPPLKSETIIIHKKQAEKKTISVDNSTIKKNTSAEIKTSLKAKTETRETTSTSWYWWLISGCLIPIIIGLVRKFKKL